MIKTNRMAALAGLSLVAMAGCSDFLSCGECVNDPNRPTAATTTQYFVGVQSNLMALLGSDMARSTGILAQQFSGGLQQYLALESTYEVSEQTTNGFHQALYASGGLVDVRKEQAAALAQGDSLFLGIAKVQEALLMGTGADLFGALVYREALKPEVANPPLDSQLQIYGDLQTLLDDAIKCLNSNAASNAGPGSADLSYGGDPAQWTKLAHTLKARYYLHTAEVDQAAWPKVAAEAAQGITDPADNFVAVFSGAAGERNFYYEFDLGSAGRGGYLIPNAGFVSLLQSRNDPRLADYFNADQSDLSDTRLAPDYTQTLISSEENLLAWAEAACAPNYTTAGAKGCADPVTAQAQLNAARAQAGLGSEVAVGTSLLTEVLTEEYIANFQTIEAWMTYKRSCWPNLVPTAANKKIPARLPYDAAERQTNTSIPALIDQPNRNENDPANPTDPTGAACQGQ
jgi:hypothetical protein